MSDTLDQLIASGAPIKWWCSVVPSHYGDADLVAMAKVKGGGFVLRNRKPRCKVPGCPGRITFKNHSGVYWQSMDTISHEHEAWWDLNEDQRAKLKALGWKIKMGKWIAPP